MNQNLQPLSFTLPMRRLWSYKSSVPIRGLSLAREPQTVLLWDANHVLTWLTPNGTVQARWEAPSALAAVDCADDGYAAVAVGTQGQVWFLTPELTIRWQKTVADKATAVALAPFADAVAVAAGNGRVHFLDRTGRAIATASNPRPFLHLEFVPERPFLLGSADFGSVAAFNLSGERRWHDSPVAHCGSLATTGNGLVIALACFSEGVNFYDLRGQKQTGGPRLAPCRLVAMSYDGLAILTAGLDGVVRLHDGSGKVRSDFRPDAAVAALALDALGKTAFLGLADGSVLAMQSL